MLTHHALTYTVNDWERRVLLLVNLTPMKMSATQASIIHTKLLNPLSILFIYLDQIYSYDKPYFLR